LGGRQGIVHVEESAGDDGVVFHAAGEALSHFKKAASLRVARAGFLKKNVPGWA